jgi:hypothetical protein
MPLSSWAATVSMSLVRVVHIANSWIHVSALLAGLIIWHCVFPHTPITPDTRLLPSKKQCLQRLQTSKEFSTRQKDGDCPTCWDELESPIRLNCGHRFCESCIIPWLEGNDSCPICRKTLYAVKTSNGETLNIIAHKLRICAAIINITTTIVKVLPCSWILHGWQTTFVPLLQCTMGGTSLIGCLDDLVYIVLSILMVVSAKSAIATHGPEWHRTQLSGVRNIVATIGWLRHCESELRILSAIADLALKRKK